MLSNQWFGRRFLKVLLWLPWQPEFFIEHNYLKENNNAIQLVVWEKDIYKGFTLVAMAT